MNTRSKADNFFFIQNVILKGENCHALIYITFIYIFAFIHQLAWHNVYNGMKEYLSMYSNFSFFPPRKRTLPEKRLVWSEFNKSKIYPSLFVIEDFYVILYANKAVPEAL